MVENSLSVPVTLGLVVGLVTYFGVSIVLGVPTWYLTRSLVPGSVVVPEDRLLVDVKPKTPFVIGEDLQVTVRATPLGSVVEGATVTVIGQGVTVFATTTNKEGIANIKFIGEPTIIRAEKRGFEPAIAVVPNVPTPWALSMMQAAVGAIFTGLITFILSYRSQKRSKQSRKRRKVK